MAKEAEQPFDQEHGRRDDTVRLLAMGQKVFNRYRLIRILGRGGMGVVWLAMDEELEREVALKFLPESICHDKEAAAELKRETKRSLELTHPNIVRIYDFVHDDERAAIAMEYIDGRTLSALKAERPNCCFEVKDIAAWVQQLCSALDYAHGIGKVVHQDLKPANIMVNSKGQLKVTDFGIARSISDSVTRVTAEDTVGGTLVFMSPQQLNGERPTASNDVYSLGATIYDLLTSKPPFYTGSLHYQIEKKMPAMISERRSEFKTGEGEIPKAWDETINMCLAKKPEERPADAAEVATRLGLRGGSEANWMTKLPGRTNSKKQFKPLTATSVMSVAAVMIVLIALGFVLWGRKPGANAGAAVTNPPAKGEAVSKTPVKVQLPPPLPLADLGDRFTNSLGMVFVKIEGLEDTFFSVWETRVADFKTFATNTRHDATKDVTSVNESGEFGSFGKHWNNPGWSQTPEHPAIGMSRPDGMKFCEWLTGKEKELGGVPEGFEYRLPTDAEWSRAAGLKNEQGAQPAERDGKVTDQYPWGSEWPPPSAVGNYAFGDDGYPFTAPVGRFLPNSAGLYDIGGNAWEWCLDAYDDSAVPTERRGVLRGASYMSGLSTPTALLLSSRRDPTWSKPAVRNIEMGFRCVLTRKTSRQGSPVINQ